MVQALAGVTMVTGYKRRRRLLLSRVTLRGSGPRVGASVCRMRPQTLRLALELAERADAASSARGAGDSGRETEGVQERRTVIETGDRQKGRG